MKFIPRKIKRRPIKKEIRDRVLLRDGKCLCCGAIKKLQVDHIIPVSMVIEFPRLEGTNEEWEFLNSESNLQTLCGICNRFKVFQDYRKFTDADRDGVRQRMIIKMPG